MNSVFVELLAILFILSLLSLLIFSNWPVRIGVLTLCGGIWALSYGFDRWTRFRVGDQVLIVLGPHQGTKGTVVELLHQGRGARVQLLIDGQTSPVDFHGGYELKRIHQ